MKAKAWFPYNRLCRKDRLNRNKVRFHMIVYGGGNDPDDRDDYMETRLKGLNTI